MSKRDASAHQRWFEFAVQALIFYSVGCYFVESELTEGKFMEGGAPFWQWNERMIAALFTGEYLFRWWHAKQRSRYPFSMLALIDLAAILPFYMGLAVDMRSLRLVRTLRILRLFKLYRYSRALQKLLQSFRAVKDELAVIGFVVIIMVMFSSVAIFEFEHDVQPKAFARLSDAMWWSLVTLTTVGYGDIIPITTGGRAIAMITMVIGIGIFGTFVSLIGGSLVAAMREDAYDRHVARAKWARLEEQEAAAECDETQQEMFADTWIDRTPHTVLEPRFSQRPQPAQAPGRHSAAKPLAPGHQADSSHSSRP